MVNNASHKDLRHCDCRWDEREHIRAHCYVKEPQVVLGDAPAEESTVMVYVENANSTIATVNDLIAQTASMPDRLLRLSKSKRNFTQTTDVRQNWQRNTHTWLHLINCWLLNVVISTCDFFHYDRWDTWIDYTDENE